MIAAKGYGMSLSLYWKRIMIKLKRRVILKIDGISILDNLASISLTDKYIHLERIIPKHAKYLDLYRLAAEAEDLNSNPWVLGKIFSGLTSLLSGKPI